MYWSVRVGQNIVLKSNYVHQGGQILFPYLFSSLLLSHEFAVSNLSCVILRLSPKSVGRKLHTTLTSRTLIASGLSYVIFVGDVRSRDESERGMG